LQDTSVPVGTGQALLVGADGVVRDDSWMEVFESEAGLVAIVQASGPDYPDALARALGYPAADDQDGDAIAVSSGELASSAPQATVPGPTPMPWSPPAPGQCPPFTARPLARRTPAS